MAYKAASQHTGQNAHHKAALGTGARFASLKATLEKRKGVTDPGALAAWIGRRKYGKAGFAKLSRKG